MTDLTLSDLASSGAEQAAESAAAETAKQAASGQSSGEWMVSLYDRLREDNLVMPLLFGPDAAPTQEQPQNVPATEVDTMNDESHDDGEESAENGEQAAQIDARTVAAICGGIEEKAGDLRISQIRTACENRPEFVNQMIEQHAGDFE